jgi:hypothetical protein
MQIMRLWQMYVCVLLLAGLILGGALLLAPKKRGGTWDECKSPRDSIAASLCAEFR